MTVSKGLARNYTITRLTPPLALVGGTIHPSPGEPPIPDGVVLIRGSEIAEVGPRSALSVPADTRVLDCSGLAVTAGFWNCHVHFFERKWAGAAAIPARELERQLEETFTRYGFTSVFDLSSSSENTRALRARIEAGEVAGPRILSTGEGLVPPGALPPDAVLHLMGIMPAPLPEIADAEGAAAAARRLLEAGADGIKIFASPPRGAPLAEDVLRAAVREAHRAGKPAFVHPNTTADGSPLSAPAPTSSRTRRPGRPPGATRSSPWRPSVTPR